MIISNVFQSNLTIDDIRQNLDVFKIEGVGVGFQKYGIISKAIKILEQISRTSFVQYSENQQDYAIGFIKTPIKDTRMIDAHVTYEGKKTLDPSLSLNKTLASLLNKTKEYKLRAILWKGGPHAFFSKKGTEIHDNGYNILLFEGLNFRYNILNDGRIVLSLDVMTKYYESSPYLEYIEENGLQSLMEEIEYNKQYMKNLGRTFKGIHFFYSLSPMDVTIDGFDPRPISEIPVKSYSGTHGNDSQTIADYLLLKYHNKNLGGRLDLDQPGLRQGTMTFAPQFLFKSIPFQDVPSKIKDGYTYYTDDAPFYDRDLEHTARTRWNKTMDFFEKYDLSLLDFGPHKLLFQKPLEYPPSNHFRLPYIIAGRKKRVLPSQIQDELKNGLYQIVRIKKIFVFSKTKMYLKHFYRLLVQYAKSQLNVRLPNKPIILETDLKAMETQIQRSLSIKPEQSLVIAIIDDKDNQLHDKITNICGHLGVPSKCITSTVVKAITGGKKFYLSGFISSLLTRAGFIPWVLDTKLHYDCYIAIDVGRAKSETWAFLIVYNKNGLYKLGEKKLTVGESITKVGLESCIEYAQSAVPNARSIIYLRDGSIGKQEYLAFQEILERSALHHGAIVSVRESTPFRIYRGNESDVWRPNSGDYYILDNSNIVLCAAGADEYSHGTPNPIVIDFIPIKGTIEMLKAVEDIFRLSYLNWASPGKSFSTPAPLRMAHKLARETSLGLERSTLPF